MQTNKVNGFFALAAVLVFSGIGLAMTQYGEATALAGASFGSVLMAFGEDGKTRAILTAIILDVTTGVIAALRTNTFDAARVAQFYRSNVVPYVLGYLVYWLIVFLGFAEYASADVLAGVASLGFGAILTTLTASAIDNIRRAYTGTVPPSDAAIVSELSPNVPQG